MSEIEPVEVIYREPNENEINMLKGTFKPEELIEIEKTEEVNRDLRKEYITKVKVIALHTCGKGLLDNPSYMSYKDKNEIMKCMEKLLNEIEEDITEKFNILISENLFNSKTNLEKLYNK